MGYASQSTSSNMRSMLCRAFKLNDTKLVSLPKVPGDLVVACAKHLIQIIRISGWSRLGKALKELPETRARATSTWLEFRRFCYV